MEHRVVEVFAFILFMQIECVAVPIYGLRFPFLFAEGKVTIGKWLYCERLVAILEAVGLIAYFFGQLGGRLLISRMQKIPHFLLLVIDQLILQLLRLLLAISDA